MKIKELREAADMTKAELARYMGVDLTAVLKWETGVNLPRLPKLVKLADLFGVSLDYLCGREPPDTTRAS